MTRAQISSLATTSPFVVKVDVLKRAPGTTSRVFPACYVSQNALTLTERSSALHSITARFLTSLQHFPRQRPLIISRRY